MKLYIGIDWSVESIRRGFIFATNLNGIHYFRRYCIPPNFTNIEVARFINRFIWFYSEITIAIDAPLGWPANMIKSLLRHKAGDKVQNFADETRANFFRRETDKFVARRCNQTPLSVGADKIAAMAYDALDFIDLLHHKFTVDVRGNGQYKYKIIEVYPSIMLKQWNIKKLTLNDNNFSVAKMQYVEKISEIAFPNEEIKFDNPKLMCENDHFLDAYIACITGILFDRNVFVTPQNEVNPDKIALIIKEGWIWGLYR